MFGARGASTLLSKATTTAAIIFMITSLALTVLVSRPGGASVIRGGATPKQTQPAPAPTAPAQQNQQNPAPAQPPAEQPK